MQKTSSYIRANTVLVNHKRVVCRWSCTLKPCGAQTKPNVNVIQKQSRLLEAHLKWTEPTGGKNCVWWQKSTALFEVNSLTQDRWAAPVASQSRMRQHSTQNSSNWSPDGTGPLLKEDGMQLSGKHDLVPTFLRHAGGAFSHFQHLIYFLTFCREWNMGLRDLQITTLCFYFSFTKAFQLLWNWGCKLTFVTDLEQKLLCGRVGFVKIRIKYTFVTCFASRGK